MIISDDHGFIFVHIPKCAGTSIKRRLKHIDTTGGRFFPIGDHPELGAIHLAHITLADLQAYFPESFAKLYDYRSFALVRDPMDRFFSAIFQRLREFGGQGQSAITPEMVEDEGRKIIRYLESAPERLDLEHVHFNRQSDFIELRGRRMVQEVFAVEQLAEAGRYVEAVTGIKIGEERRNRTTEMSFGALKPLQRMLRAPYSKLFSAEFRADVREKMTRAGFYKDIPKQQFVHPGSAVAQFVRDYYRRDFVLHEECLAAPALACA